MKKTEEMIRVLKQARTLLKKPNSWRKGVLGIGSDRMCLLGAIANSKTCPRFEKVDIYEWLDEQPEVKLLASKILEKGVIVSDMGYPTTNVYSFNDMQIDKKPVLELLDECIADLRK